MTVCWHVDDLNISHINPQEINKFGYWLSISHRVSAATHQGKVNGCLGMIFDFSKKGTVTVSMIEYIKNIIADLLEEMTAAKTSLVVDHIFEVQDKLKAKSLPEERAMAFHHATPHSACTRRDIQPATAFV
jgi:hypothetical protein